MSALSDSSDCRTHHACFARRYKITNSMSPNPNPPMYIGIILTSEETQQDILLTFLLPHQNPNEFVLAVQVMNRI
jgi:hypothetical protein